MRDAPDGPTDDGRGDSPPVGHEGTERPRHRPRDAEEPREYASGQKKGHPLKPLLVIEATCPMGVWSATDDGTANEKRLAALEGSRGPPGRALSQERGVQGFVRAGVTMVHPQKKPRGGDRTPPEPATPRRLSSRRIRSEHALGGVKGERMGQDTIRLLKDRSRDPVMAPCGGWHNVRRQYRPWHDAA